MSKLFEINGDLTEYENYDKFKNVIREVRTKFQDMFGADTLSRLPLFIDNCTAGGGYTPCTSVVLQQYVTIRLNISDFNRVEQTTYQFAHEMTHFTYRCLIGIFKKRATVYEESICSAMSLCFLYGNSRNFQSWCDHVRKLKNEGYRKGYDVALACGFSPERLRDKILAELNDYRKIAL
ncbi:MAG: hypothetical protein J1G02_04060 [Clostridiales bacterium]|nr:hypothetical protein [Clostridiales bacterium]